MDEDQKILSPIMMISATPRNMISKMSINLVSKFLLDNIPMNYVIIESYI